MKKIIILIPIIALIITSSCNSRTQDTGNKVPAKEANAGFYYTCTMHPEIHSDKPGKCPKCGMELVKKEVAASDTMHMQPGDTMKMK